MRDYRRIFGHIAGALVVLAAIAYITHRPGHIPPYDANLVRIVETERQGYCAGKVGWKTAFAGDAAQASTCRSEHPEQSGKVNMRAAERGFCQAILDAGWDGWMEGCLQILAEQQLWPTYDGSLTDQWNRARPYPSPPLGEATSPADDSRTGGRSGVDRGAEYSDRTYP